MKNTVLRHFTFTIFVIFLLQSLMLCFILGSFYKSSIRDIKAMSVSNMKSQAAMVESYLNHGSDVLWVVAQAVDHMMQDGTDIEDLTAYLREETAAMQSQLDDNFTDLYGLIKGTYVDGSGWEPGEDFDPFERNWYIEAVNAGGSIILSEPYLDAYTGKTIISFSQLLSDGESVISLDIILDQVQHITEKITIAGMGYSFITDSKGFVLSHTDPDERGKNYSEYPEWKELQENIDNYGSDGFEMMTEDGRSTVFADDFAGDWRVVIVVQNSYLYRNLWIQILTAVFLSLIIFAIIVIFCVISARRITLAEQNEEESRNRMQQMNLNIIRSLASTIDAKDRYTSGHSQRVAEYALEISKRMGLSEHDQQIVYYAGLLHDVGKIRVPVEVINKPGRLTDEEFDQIRIHPVSGYHILQGIHEDARIGYGAKYHHERYDGKGYPNGIEGNDIPRISRIIAVADAYDAMASDRSYRSVLPQDTVRNEILKGKGTQFDPEIADVMLQIIDEDKNYSLRQQPDQVRNILAVDDDKMILMILKHVLGDLENINIIGTGSEQEALKIMEDNDISLVILDLRMPDTDGFTLYTRLKAIKNVPAILMTGDRSSAIIQRIRELGIDDYLTKPLNGAITRETVHSILHRSRTGI